MCTIFQHFHSTLLESDRAARGRSLFDKKEEKEITREKGNTYFAFIGCLSFRTDPTGKRNEKKGKRKISIACARKISRFSDFIEASREKKEYRFLFFALPVGGDVEKIIQ